MVFPMIENHNFIELMDLSVTSTMSRHEGSSHLKTVPESTTVFELTIGHVDELPGLTDSSNNGTVEPVGILANHGDSSQNKTMPEVPVDIVSGTTLNPADNWSSWSNNTCDRTVSGTLSAPIADIADKLSSGNSFSRLTCCWCITSFNYWYCI